MPERYFVFTCCRAGGKRKHKSKCKKKGKILSLCMRFHALVLMPVSRPFSWLNTNYCVCACACSWACVASENQA